IAPIGSNGLFFAPYFSGAGSPYVDRKASGAFIGLTNDSNKGSIIRSVIEALNYQSRDMIDAFENAAGSSADKIVATGGPSKSEFWNQNKADITGKLIEIPAVDEATPLGAAIVSGIGIGVYKNEKEAFDETYHLDHICEPDPKNKGLYDDYYQVYKRLYPDLKNINNSIFDRFRK
ncbi:MAG: FGGY-family carbohydrate kinase, partial [Candidatus Humimicrobiaceae bacterium]